ncbi:glycosyltransferase family protein [Campylobacter canadensis]|uniref:Lipid-A-disaccharide synthase n=1 Tax=Campylobacter canadensis TaxID=449520 RepID=A0ABS7WTE5_9BACT|nr:lipid-A-disaccharide synthase [Campylobacter canadensis]MBZ7987204.1 lipid-A-disaccharide synthase [Campylobacter canadensis]MBZ7994444.1 lipid-A-disaccharide synthase [Campylobacter canadensis]MBZ7996469.1 lipid-A-disaccharide synthase [Campylobacter canadensis]MBZ7998172.1 lipid-A-disaccharide synthase [Campylobacter canadensis]MBZ7999841.1 lipid-A-disaccharide synthase [Campylobacter canadensis]
MKLLAIALENSANDHLKHILDGLNNLSLYGIFDKNINVQNKNNYCDFSEFNAMGFVQILPLILKAKRAIKDLCNIALKENIDKILLIDSPAFNIPFAKELRKQGFKGKIIYFILPQVWAWKEGRIKVVEALCDELIGILPFEKNYFKNSHYFGNPSFNALKSYFKNDVNSKKQIAFLAGSRKSEIKALMPIFRQLRKRFSDYECILCVPSFLKDSLDYYGDISEFKISFDTLGVLKECEFAYICSGTASLQAGLIGTCFCLCYKAKIIDYLIAKNLVKIKYIGLCNIIFDKTNNKIFHKEFIQNFDIDEMYKEFMQRNKEEFLEKSKLLRELLSGDFSKQIQQIIKE